MTKEQEADRDLAVHVLGVPVYENSMWDDLVKVKGRRGYLKWGGDGWLLSYENEKIGWTLMNWDPVSEWFHRTPVAMEYLVREMARQGMQAR